jgi:hypothetical protein
MRYLVILFVLESCSTALRVYRPYPSESPYEVIVPQPKVTIITPTTEAERFALNDPYFGSLAREFKFLGSESNLKNEYGTLTYLLKKEFSIRSENYPMLLSEGGKIEIKEFELRSIDKCYVNIVEIKIRAEVQIGKRKIETFEYYDSIRSRVTDCYMFGSSLLIVPLIWYVPYTGFRGNREDQLNQLGRNGLESFFSFLENQSGYIPKRPMTLPILKPSPGDVVRDPKIKEIMDDL